MAQKFDLKQERAFLALLQPFMNLERKQDRHYSHEDYSLRRMDALAAAAGNPERDLDFIHIAGTKGKSSTAILTGAMLSSRGHSTGVFTSPHLFSVRERFMINNQLPDYEFLITETRKLVQTVQERCLPANFFELMTVLALRLFSLSGCRYAVVETGIGGLLDATNYIPPPQCVIITAISFDHTDLLGKTIALITAQKAGIIKTGVAVVVAPQPWSAEVLPILEAETAKKGGSLHLVDPASAAEFPAAHGLPPVHRENFAAALTAVRIVGVEPDRIKFTTPILTGRMQCLRRRPLLIVDGAHNRDSARRLVESLQVLYPQKVFTVILGVAKGKDCEGILQQLAILPRVSFILTNPRPGKESALAELIAVADKIGVTYQVQQKIDRYQQLPSGRNLLFTGSFLTAMIGAEVYEETALTGGRGKTSRLSHDH